MEKFVAKENFADQSSYLLALHLPKGKAYKVKGIYSDALLEIGQAVTFAASEDQADLVEKLECIFNAESIMVANPGKDEWPEEFAACNYSDQGLDAPIAPNPPLEETANIDQAQLNAQPNPTNT